ncbi:hypothetical protein METBIDRAFT_200341 [Metschnikowia bicuspidata var. bicuspidata NRRL YB-4993]|uniref:CDP-diacylglycerol--glycerol-3-phosphate 3-phosphatidyltransferase n=1 Tax=Metschnikowia bicuspidata var. bicuspidata NRRL YB-4993 TaxID=869754 RepID=A0A1A0H9F3_9ASCO|nr:hypothetical protein METBIDRAFT_200341 [Metschnikowia bicuspidata var. bicuspidata NRRL YB-4993]OBA20517.1 hypothetical protein METBIDRAFT_200341 [Metschnikowia bicuspidata var. bicuspidata NRRL YB-4993]
MILRSISAIITPSRQRMIGSIYNYVFGRSTVTEQHRQYATNNPSFTPSMTASFHPRLATIFQQLDAIAPRFAVKGSDIHIILLPALFYNTLKEKISEAKSRIFLSSLYVGQTQEELVECLAEALTKNENLKLHILTDALRGTREAPNLRCLALLLVSLVEKFGKHRVDIRMYHTPHLAGFKKNWVPKRANEGFGLQHMKLYGFDDEIILSGANLSEDYFTDRQDRYYVFKSKKMTDYYYKVQETISSLSYQLVTTAHPKGFQNFRLTWPTSNKSCEPDMNLQRFISDSSFLLEPLLKQHTLGSLDVFDDTEEFDTIVYAVSQFTPLLHPSNDLSTEKPTILRLLSYLDSPKIKWWFTAGYFNMLPQIQERFLNGQAQGTLITASAKANSFYKSSGISYYIPEAYLLIAKKFLEEVHKRGKQNLIKLYEWQNGVVNTTGGWSYHAKGIWLSVPEEDVPSITVIGSSNYTKRAYSLDLESNAVVITKNSALKERMRLEIDNLMTYAYELKLSDFAPKLQDTRDHEPKVDTQGNTIAPPQTFAIDEDRRISYRVHWALRLIGDKL